MIWRHSFFAGFLTLPNIWGWFVHIGEVCVWSGAYKWLPEKENGGGLRQLKPETYFDKVFVKNTRKALVDVLSIHTTKCSVHRGLMTEDLRLKTED